ncbi:Imm51 family immunity protein [Corynebacterium cystitidis]|uniref:Immunity protein 51 n=1 Tax=Corynebacterium cystitidis DSM 20524 TaxID=1121357 RepID=A0A1H9UY64_9CORY|nr:Imm51 family immunity protein [Corynebacterium cystitidis]WJY83643.1 hypothetical protein CCYS_13810 [Corynebacterium cystitidis DSM 20524]SES14362.1 Immunity protein 51 [Corynebacterium cystitidis DSM 20524]SNV91565.1 Uncharacterised protein [Corynebacterium cystitidis]
MAVDFKHVEYIGGYSLIFEAFTTAVDETIADRGFSPMGYFWERVVVYLWEKDELEGPFSFDCSADFFSASSASEHAIAQLKSHLEELTSQPAKVSSLIDDALADDFELEF